MGLTTPPMNFHVRPQPLPPTQIPVHCNVLAILLSLGTRSTGVTSEPGDGKITLYPVSYKSHSQRTVPSASSYLGTLAEIEGALLVSGTPVDLFVESFNLGYLIKGKKLSSTSSFDFFFPNHNSELFTASSTT